MQMNSYGYSRFGVFRILWVFSWLALRPWTCRTCNLHDPNSRTCDSASPSWLAGCGMLGFGFGWAVLCCFAGVLVAFACCQPRWPCLPLPPFILTLCCVLQCWSCPVHSMGVGLGPSVWVQAWCECEQRYRTPAMARSSVFRAGSTGQPSRYCQATAWNLILVGTS